MTDFVQSMMEKSLAPKSQVNFWRVYQGSELRDRSPLVKS